MGWINNSITRIIKNFISLANGTDSISLFLSLLGIKSQDKVITTPFTCTPTIEAIINSAKAVVIKSFGSGNSSTSTTLSKILSDANDNGKILLNITQCLHGSAVLGHYETSEPFGKSGVICGKDMTTEAAITKLMFLLGKGLTDTEIKTELQTNLRGEISN